MKEPISVSTAARILGISAQHVRGLERQGKIQGVKTDTGQRLFDKHYIERLAEQRKGSLVHLAERNVRGVGIVLTDDDDLAGIDLDSCRDDKTGDIAMA